MCLALRGDTKKKNPEQNQNCPALFLHQVKRLAQQEAGIQRGEWETMKSGLPATEEKSTRVWAESEPGVSEERANRRCPFMCLKQKDTPTSNLIVQGAQGWRQHKGRLSEWVLVSVFAQEDFGELSLPNCFWSRQIQDSISLTAEKGRRMFSPRLTNEMWINCRDRMAQAAS